jgi:hypothetical protein
MRAFAIEYQNTLVRYLKSGGRDNEAYTWLVHRSVKMQTELGALGVLHGYKPPAANYFIKDYQIVLNMLHELHTSLQSGLPIPSLIDGFAHTLQDTIIRHVGVLDDRISASQQQTRNPILWFREGIETLLAIPFQLLNWFGLLGARTTATVTQNPLFRLLSGIISVIAFSSAIVGLVTGWDEFLAIVTRIFGIGP